MKITYIFLFLFFVNCSSQSMNTLYYDYSGDIKNYKDSKKYEGYHDLQRGVQETLELSIKEKKISQREWVQVEHLIKNSVLTMNGMPLIIDNDGKILIHKKSSFVGKSIKDYYDYKKGGLNEVFSGEYYLTKYKYPIVYSKFLNYMHISVFPIKELKIILISMTPSI